MKIKLKKEEDKLIIRYSEFKLALLTVILLFFIVFPLLLPARIIIHQNLYFVIAVLIAWLASAIIFLFAHIKSKVKYSYLRYADIIIDVLFLGAILFALSEINSNYFFLFAFIIFGAAFYLDKFLVLCSGIFSAIILLAGFFIESKTPISFSEYFLIIVKLAFILVITYFVYLFVISFMEILEQKIRIKKISSLNRGMLVHFSNQLRAPLPVIRDFIEILFMEKAGPLNRKQKEILTLLHEDTKELIEESSSVVYYDLIKTKNLFLNKKKVNLIDLINGVILRSKDELINRKIKMIYRPRQNTINISVDKGKISNAFYTFLRNIIMRVRGSSKIRISTKKSKYSDYVRIIFCYKGEKVNKSEMQSPANLDMYVASKIISLSGGNISNISKQNKKQKIIIILPSN